MTVDAALAGSGNIEIRVNGGRVACSVENRGNHCFLASFVPEDLQTHVVDMTFNDQEVEGEGHVWLEFCAVALDGFGVNCC